jgi:hypothetical protein
MGKNKKEIKKKKKQLKEEGDKENLKQACSGKM